MIPRRFEALFKHKNPLHWSDQAPSPGTQIKNWKVGTGSAHTDFWLPLERLLKNAEEKTWLNSPFSKGDQNRFLHPNQKSESLIKVCIGEVFCCISKNHTVWVCLIDLSKLRDEIYRRRKKQQKNHKSLTISDPTEVTVLPQIRASLHPREKINKSLSESRALQTPTPLSQNKEENKNIFPLL